MFSKDLFGKRISEIRKLNCETQKAFGEAIGMSSNNLCEVEAGKKTTTAEKIALICKHYHVSADYLLGLSDDVNGGFERWNEEEEP
jgi:transcriptional regulator with XRE-family HTH domain